MEEKFIDKKKISKFQKCVISFALKQGENFPWRNLKGKEISPWEVSIGEILLNRVSAERVFPIYTKLLHSYSSPCSLARVDKKELISLLTPIGLQEKKAEILIKVSNLFCKKDNLNLIKKELKKIKGIGKNTYNAILLFGFNEKAPLMDGVIGRVLSRVFGVNWKGKAVTDKKAWMVSEKLLPENIEDAKLFYYGLIDIGRSFCLRFSPKCGDCSCKCICFYYNTLKK